MLLKFPVASSLKYLCNKFYTKLPLATILFGSFALQICGAVGLVGFISFRNGKTAVREFASQLENEVCDRVEQYLDRYLKLPQQINQINLDAIQLGLLDVTDLKTTWHYFWKQMQVFDVGYISFSNPKWELVGVERLESNKFLIRQTSVSKTGLVKQVAYITDSRGNLVKLPATAKVPSLTREFLYINAVKAGKSVWSKNYQLQNKSVLSISNSYPVYDSDRKLIGVLGTNINFSQIDKFLAQVKLARSGNIFILERDGLIVASSQSSHSVVKNQPKHLSVFNSEDSLIQQTKQHLIQQFGSLSLLREQQKLVFSSSKANYFVHVKPWQSEIGLDWLVVVVIPENEFTEKIHANTLTTFLLCIVSFLIATLFSLFTTRWILNPILQLTTSVKKIAEGKLNETAKIKNFKELAEVTNLVTNMAKQLQKSFAKLKAKNAELKILNKTLSQSESRLAQFVEAMPIGVMLAEANGRISYKNTISKQVFEQAVIHLATIEEITKVYQVYLAGTDQLYPSDRLPAVRALQGENVTVDDIEIRYPDKIIYLEASGKAIYDESGNIVFVIATFVDISQRKQTQKLLAEYNRTLKIHVKKRTSELLKVIKQLQSSQKELIKSQEIAKQGQKAAEQANQAKSEFLANMSHELRTPLNAILGFTQMMSLDKTLTVENKQNLAIVNSAGEHLLHLINDILEVSKIEAGKTTLNLSSFDLILLLENIKQTLGLRAAAKGLKLVFEYAPNLPRFIKTDSHKLRQVLLNLLGNAIKFTDIGSVTLRVRRGIRKEAEEQRSKEKSQDAERLPERVRRQPPKALLLQRRLRTSEGAEEQYPIPDIQSLIFEVTDTGSGISPDEIHLLFKPFGQTENGRKSQQGTGLGLAISQNYVQLMGGKIGVNSKVGVGSTFTFNIQINISDCSEIVTNKFQHQIIGLAGTQGEYRILIVDDHQESRLFLVKLLSSIGYSIKEATNGAEAISVCESWQPHLILMDMQMPVMDGYEAIRRIRAKETEDTSRTRTIIIALTATAFKEERQKMLSANCDDFISKPFSLEVLLEKLSEYLGVKYTAKFTNQNTEAIANQIQPTLTSTEVITQLLQFSPQWIAQLHHAAASCSDELILDLLKQIPQDKAQLVQIFSDLANNYQFEKIMELTRANAE
ncbi:MAG: response regulator [Chlorogloeopsis fritschii C42_A2020_084]|uniref:response regulator n=1 Tax=Chlorogloeopsis fritschii TaxID=1124 RepID=UPI001A104C71|nr:response regulator [Chlorogloeopsis fritschii]MBF2007638.1 response regulator [Chlorogloeopsis fritschii C42_A2020_084]